LPYSENPAAARPNGGPGAEAPGDLWILSIAGKYPAGGIPSRRKRPGNGAEQAFKFRPPPPRLTPKVTPVFRRFKTPAALSIYRKKRLLFYPISVKIGLEHNCGRPQDGVVKMPEKSFAFFRRPGASAPGRTA